MTRNKIKIETHREAVNSLLVSEMEIKGQESIHAESQDYYD